VSRSLVSLVARGVSFSYGPTTVLDTIDLTVSRGDRIGVVAPNGTGKSTLLKVLGGLLVPDDGSVTLAPPIATIGYLSQEPDLLAGETAREALARGTGVRAATASLDAATAALAEGTERAEDAYAATLDQWLRLGGADFDARVAGVCSDLGLNPELLDRDSSALSGGQASRVALAMILLSQHDVLLLDEPTNDLDFEGLDRLERFVAEASPAMVIVSHDRAFLARTITSVFELDGHDHRGTLYNGGWEAFLEERAVARHHAEEAFENYRRARDELEARARKQRQWAVIGKQRASKRPTDNDKAQRDFRLNRTEKQAAKVRVSEKALARLEPIQKPWEGWDLHYAIEAGPRSGDVVARLDRAVVKRGSFQLGPIDLEVRWADRIALLGPNGSGKSTLLDAVLGRVPLSEGARWFGPSVVVGELDQVRAGLTEDGPLVRSFQLATGLPTQDARSLLAKFGLGAEHVLRPTGSLSPGERTRAVLASLTARGVNCLVLDEPTNHLDLEAIEQLQHSLTTWQGTLLLVTHDRALLAGIAINRTVQLPQPAHR
jgi:ATPase subunit of ABC transporter with duplicated ATPase domains